MEINADPKPVRHLSGRLVFRNLPDNGLGEAHSGKDILGYEVTLSDSLVRFVVPAVSAFDVVAEVEEHLGRHVAEAALGV